MNRALTIGAVVIVVLGLGVAAYFLFFANPGGVVVTPGGGGLPVSGDAGGGGGGTVATSTTPVSVSVTLRLVEIDKGPVVPGVVAYPVGQGDASSTPDVAISYLNRLSGNIFTYLAGAHTLTRVSNRTIPGIQEAAWLPDGSSALVRYLSGDNQTINTYALPASGTGGFFLPQNITSIATASSSILWLASGVNGSIGSTERADGSGVTQVFSTPLASARASFAGKSSYMVFTKPSSSLPGYAFLSTGGALTRVAGPLNGLVALASPSGSWAVVSYSAGGLLKTALINLATNEALPLPVATIVDKCVWSLDSTTVYCGVPSSPSTANNYPDDWYQGVVHFNDRIWKIDVANRVASLVLDFQKEAATSLDATNLAIDPAKTVLVFRNKNDASLWMYKL